MGQHLAGMDRELFEDVVFLRRQLHRLAVPLDQPAHQVDLERAAGERPVRALLLQAVTQRGPQARHQFLGPERLGDVIVGAEIESRHLGRLVAAARQHDDGHRRQRADVGDQLEPVAIGQAEIEQH